MLYVIGFFCPPFAILWCGKIFQAIFSLALYVAGILLFFVGGLGAVILIAAEIHAFAVIHGRNADRRNAKLIKAMGKR